MMKFYAVIKGDNIVGTVKKVKAEIIQPDHIEIESFNAVQVGNLYHPDTGQFEQLPKVRKKIPSLELWERFLRSEQESLVDSNNAKIKRFLYELRIRSLVNLENAQLITAINALETAGIIAAGRADEILQFVEATVST